MQKTAYEQGYEDCLEKLAISPGLAYKALLSRLSKTLPKEGLSIGRMRRAGKRIAQPKTRGARRVAKKHLVRVKRPNPDREALRELTERYPLAAERAGAQRMNFPDRYEYLSTGLTGPGERGMISKAREIEDLMSTGGALKGMGLTGTNPNPLRQQLLRSAGSDVNATADYSGNLLRQVLGG